MTGRGEEGDPVAQEPAPDGIIAIVRLRSVRPPDELFEALLAGGVRAVEVTMGTPGVLETVTRWCAREEAWVGVGTVRTPEHARLALRAGAQFLVTPTTMPAVLDVAVTKSVPVIAGALTPTEVDTAWQHGASRVKVFPIDAVGGPAYLRALQAPFPEISFVPTGGVGTDEARTFAGMGCRGVGVGSALVDESAVAEARWDELEQRAQAMTAAWAAGLRA